MHKAFKQRWIRTQILYKEKRTHSWFNTMSAEPKITNPTISLTKAAMELSPGSSTVVKEHSRFSSTTLDSYLYGKKIVQAIDMENIRKQKTSEKIDHERKSDKEKSTCSKACDVCLGKKEGQCATHGPMQSLRQLVHAEDQGKTYDDIKATYAVMSFPDEVQLCTSSIPGATYGVCARQHLPSGTWIGPYEGRRTADQWLLHKNEDHEHLWEIYEEGKFSHFIDGSDENCSSWMRFIRCARDAEEQNMSAFQYGQNIYYRAFRDISVGEELLVWYSDTYLKHLEVPLSLKDSERNNTEEPAERPSERVTSDFPVKHVSAKLSTPERVLTRGHPEHSPTTFELPYGSRIGKSTVRYSFQSFEPVAPTIQQTLANQIKERRERTPSFPNGPTAEPKKEVSECSPKEMISTSKKDCQARFSERENVETGIQDTVKPSGFSDVCSPFKCRQCLKVFTQRIQLQMHVCPKSPYKPFQCGHCSLSFALSSELRNHVVVHTSERPFKCGFCGRSFAGATTLNNHVRTHTGEKPFVCNSCGKTFSIATQLSRHTRVPGECARYIPNESSSKHLEKLENKQV